MPEMTGLLLILHLCVRDRSIADGTPVDDPAALVDPSLLMHLHKDFRDSLVAALVHGEAFAVPVTGGTELFELIYDPSAVFPAPIPAVLQELLASQILLADPLLLEIVDDPDFRCDRCVVGPGLPEGIKSLHPLPPDQDILHRIVQSVAHVELPGDIRRRDHDREGGPAVVYFRMEVLFLLPVFIDPVLDPLGIVSLGEHLSHVFSP